MITRGLHALGDVRSMIVSDLGDAPKKESFLSGDGIWWAVGALAAAGGVGVFLWKRSKKKKGKR